MPLISTAKVNINSEPIEGSLEVTPTEGDSLESVFNIRVINYLDEDAPLSYKFFFYVEERLYELERELGVNPVSSKRDFLKDGGFFNELNIQLPMGRKSSNSSLDMIVLLMVSVSDSLGAVTNSTTTIRVKNKYGSLSQ